jgi:1-acyl-sn-glycerol-3-phosphate acyltransferase
MLVTHLLRRLLKILCRIDARDFFDALKAAIDGYPDYRGPMIVMINHINFLEVPMLVSFAYPFHMTGLVKDSTWRNPMMSFLMNTYKAVPINREGAYREAFAKAAAMLKQGYFMIMAPEGRRSGDGVLSKAKGGIIQLALAANVPILPVAHFGGENIWRNMKHLRRTPFNFNTGHPFRINCGPTPDKEERAVILDEIMGTLARLLPEEKRGEYTQAALGSCPHLEFL